MTKPLLIASVTALCAAGIFLMPPVPAAEPAPPAAAQPAAQDAAAQAQAAIDKGLAYLKTQQKPDFSWQNPKEPPGFTALVLRAFLQDPAYKPDQPFLQKGLAKLLSFQGADGSISKDMLTNYNTAIAVTALAAANDPQYAAAIDKAVAYLKNLQWDDTLQGVKNQNERVKKDDPRFGGWGYGKHSRPDGSNLQITLDALHDAGVKPSDPAYQNAIQFVQRMQNRSESNDQPWAGNDGGFVYTPANNGESEAGEYKGPDGKRMLRSYGSMTYAGFKSLIYAGLSKDDPRVKAAWDWIGKNWTVSENPGMGAANPANAQNGLYYYFMTMGRALNAYDQPVITDAQGKEHDWRVELINQIASLQKADGSWLGEARWMEGSPVLATAYAVIALEAAQKDLKEHPVGAAAAASQPQE
jgi:squalene-hopene/tetraprenyl-beta-curcumene cyclase